MMTMRTKPRPRARKTVIKILSDIVDRELSASDIPFSGDPAVDAQIKSNINFYIRNNVKKPIEDVLRHMRGEIRILDLRERNGL